MLFRKKRYSLAQSGLLNGYTEWHCHVLPGVDDGVQTMEEALNILLTLEENGASNIWFTPHVMEELPNEAQDLNSRFLDLKKQYKGTMVLHLAAENMLDNLFDEHLEKGTALPLTQEGNHMLVETSYFTPPFDLDEKLQRTMSKGYFPILAHPERYSYMRMEDYDHLHRMGVKMQLNIFSLFNMYGPEAAMKARQLLKKGYYNIFGTDTHRLRQLDFALTHPGLTAREIDHIHELSL